MALAVGLGSPVSAVAATGTSTTTAPTTTSTASTSTTTLPSGRVSHVQVPDASSTVTWSATSTTPGATGVSYTYSFTVGIALVISSVTMTVPAGTAGTPMVVSVSGLPQTTSVSLTNNTLTYSGFSTLAALGTTVTITIGGLTNTTVGGTYSSLVTLVGVTTESAGSNALSFVGPLVFTPPTALAWAATITASTQTVVDSTQTQQQFGVYDNTGSGAGWNLLMSASTFVNSGSTALPSGAITVTGSTTSATSTAAPSTACAISGCTLPSNTTTYPVTITAGSTSLTKIYDTAATSGLGSITIGGSTATDPVGWWATVLPTAAIGSYTSVITFELSSGP